MSTITIDEFLERLDSIEDSKRENFIKPIVTEFCDLSKRQLSKFQLEWDFDNKTFEEFKIAQNKQIKECIEIEKSFVGSMVRNQSGLGPFPDTFEIEEKINS
jgi:hypothetical protein